MFIYSTYNISLQHFELSASENVFKSLLSSEHNHLLSCNRVDGNCNTFSYINVYM